MRDGLHGTEVAPDHMGEVSVVGETGGFPRYLEGSDVDIRRPVPRAVPAQRANGERAGVPLAEDEVVRETTMDQSLGPEDGGVSEPVLVDESEGAEAEGADEETEADGDSEADPATDGEPDETAERRGTPSEGATGSGPSRDGASPENESASGEDVAPAPTDDTALIDFELAEHERWAGSFGDLGTARSDERAAFVLSQTSSGASSGLTGGLGMGLVMGAAGGALGQIAGRRLATLAVSRGATAVPVPGLGPAIGGVMAVAGLAMRDWGATFETIGRFGTGEGYEGLANDLEGLAEALDLACSIMDVVGGVCGAIAVGMWVGTVISGGTLAPLALTLSAIGTGISIATAAVGVIISAAVRPAVMALRALHTFQSDADPASVEAGATQLQAAASQVTGAVGGAVGGRIGGAAGGRAGARADRLATRMAARRGGRPALSATAGPGPRIHAEVPDSPVRAGAPEAPLARAAADPSSARPAASDGPAAAAPRRRSRASEGEADVDPRLADIAEIMADAQRLPSGRRPDEATLGNLPGPPGRALRRGERDPGNFSVPRAARSRLARSSRRAAMRELGEAVASGTDTPRTAAARETLTPDQLLALTDPATRRADPEAARGAERSVEASHVPAVATEPHDAHTGANVEVLPTEVHREGIHGSDTTRSLETSRPNPGYRGRPGFHEAGGRAPPTARTDRGHLRGAEADAAHLERRFPDADPAEIADARRWLADRRAELDAAGTDNFDTPPAARSPARSPAPDATPASTPPRYAPHTETVRTRDRAAAMAQYHDQIRTDPGRESGVWRGPDGTFYVMQGDGGSVRPPSAPGPLELVYHSHPTEADAAMRGLVSQPSQANGDLGVLAYQHGNGPAGRRVESELHFPTYDAAGNPSGYGATRFAYDPTSPLPLQVTTTLPGGRPTTQRYESFADFEARTGIRAGGDTPEASTSARVDADARLSADRAAAGRRVDETTDALLGLRPIVGAREGRDAARSDDSAPAAEGAAGEGETDAGVARGPAYAVSVAGLAPGESIELPVNPAYPPPPGTPEQLDAFLDQVDAARAAQEGLEATEAEMDAQADSERAHAEGLSEAAGVVDELAVGREAHAGAVEETSSANSDMATQAGEAYDALAEGASEASGVATLVGSLQAFRGMAHLFSYLPGSLGRSAEGARDDAGELIEALGRVGETDAAQAGVGESQATIEADAERLGAVETTGTETDAEIQTGSTELATLQADNDASLARTESVADLARSEGRAAAEHEAEAQAGHDSLLAELQAWAGQHQQARQDAIDTALTRLADQGMTAHVL